MEAWPQIPPTVCEQYSERPRGKRKENQTPDRWKRARVSHFSSAGIHNCQFTLSVQSWSACTSAGPPLVLHNGVAFGTAAEEPDTPLLPVLPEQWQLSLNYTSAIANGAALGLCGMLTATGEFTGVHPKHCCLTNFYIYSSTTLLPRLAFQWTLHSEIFREDPYAFVPAARLFTLGIAPGVTIWSLVLIHPLLLHPFQLPSGWCLSKMPLHWFMCRNLLYVWWKQMRLFGALMKSQEAPTQYLGIISHIKIYPQLI